MISAPAPPERVPAVSPAERAGPTLQGVLADHRAAVLERWREMVFGSYPEEAARFFRAEKDAFQNPVGHSLLRCTETIYDGAVLGRETEPVSEALVGLVRLRAVQDFSASEAVGFVFWLKRAVREHLRAVGVDGQLWAEMVAFDEKVDALAATAFDAYARCRDRIHAIRADELRRRTASLLKQLDSRRGTDEAMASATEGAEPEREDEG